MTVNIFTAFAAGLVSFFAPCSIAMLPVILGSFSNSFGEAISKKNMLKNTFSYIFGFTLIFVLMGIGISGIGKFLIIKGSLFEQLDGIILIILGIFVLYGHKIKAFSFLYGEKKIRVNVANLGTSRFTPFILGTTNAFAWSPCIGPILGAILLLASSDKSILNGIVLLLTYSIGISFPLIIMAGFFDAIIPRIHHIKRFTKHLYKISAVILIIIGVLLLFRIYDVVSGYVFGFISNGSSL